MTRATILILTFLVTACGGGGDDADPAPVQAAPPIAASPSEAPPPASPAAPPATLADEPETPPANEPPPTVEPDSEPRGYSVFEIDIDIPGAEQISVTHLGDDGSIAGSWRRGDILCTGDCLSGHPGVEGYAFVLELDGTLLNFDELEDEKHTLFPNFDVSHYEGEYLAGGKYVSQIIGGGCVPQAGSYILNVGTERLVQFNGVVNDLLSSGLAAGTLGYDPCFPFFARAFYWNGELVNHPPNSEFAGEPIPDNSCSHGVRLHDGKIYGGTACAGPELGWDTVFEWDIATGVVNHYLPGDSRVQLEEPGHGVEASTLDDLVDADEELKGWVTYTEVLDVNALGWILAKGTTVAGDKVFVLAP